MLNFVDALDRKASEIEYWEEADGCPEKTGQVAGISKIVLNGSMLVNQRIFRLVDWEHAIIVDQGVMECLIVAGATGVQFEGLALNGQQTP